jgi:hypothetical protein
MRNLKMLVLALVAVAMVPGLALATHFNSVAISGDCGGWTAHVEVMWRTDVYAGNLDYLVRLMDGPTILESFVWSGPLVRNPGDPQVVMYTFSAPWAGDYSAGLPYTITGDFHIVSPWTGGIDDETMSATSGFQCTVAAETSTWSTIKSLYR